MLGDTSTLQLWERLEGYVRGHLHTSVMREARARAVIEDTCTQVLWERLEGYVRGHQHPVVMSEARELC